MRVVVFWLVFFGGMMIVSTIQADLPRYLNMPAFDASLVTAGFIVIGFLVSLYGAFLAKDAVEDWMTKR